MKSAEILKGDVKDYAKTLEDVVSGADWFYDEYCDDDNDRDECDSEHDRLAKYFEDLLDVDFIVDARGNYRGARICLGLGGPSIYFNTRNGKVQGYWWSDYAEYHVQRFAVDAIDEYFSEMWDCVRGY